MHDTKGRHDLITQGWTKLGAHTRSSTSVLYVTFVFAVNQRYIVIHVELVEFLSQCRQLKQQQYLLKHTTNHNISCHSARQVLCLTLRIYYTGLPCNLRLLIFCAIVVYLPQSRAPNYMGKWKETGNKIIVLTLYDISKTHDFNHQQARA